MSESNHVQFFVAGTPQPKGSPWVMTQIRGKRLARPRVVNDTTASRKWQKEVGKRARIMMFELDRRKFEDEPLAVSLIFVLARPKSHFTKGGELKKSAPKWPAVKPDLDKLARCVLDGLEGEVFDQDSRIVNLPLRKVYASHDPADNDDPGVMITVGVAA